jgi:hemerythrin superfamily protein
MFDVSLPSNHAIALLKRDHETVKGLFDAFDKARTPAAKKKIVAQAVTELEIHATLEEEIFYPTVCPLVGEQMANEAYEEHHVVQVLVTDLGRDQNDHNDAKFTVLAESVRDHITEEEDQMLAKAGALDIDFIELGRRMLKRKRELLALFGHPANDVLSRKLKHKPGKVKA